MGSRPITFLWLWPPTDYEPHCQHVSINKIWRWTESTPRSGWWCCHMVGIYSTREINNKLGQPQDKSTVIVLRLIGLRLSPLPCHVVFRISTNASDTDVFVLDAAVLLSPESVGGVLRTSLGLNAYMDMDFVSLNRLFIWPTHFSDASAANSH